MKTLIRLVTILGAALAAPFASAQIGYVDATNNTGQSMLDLVAGAYTSASTYITYGSNVSSSNVPNFTTVSSGTTINAAFYANANGGRILGGVFISPDYALSNASVRTTITGGAFNQRDLNATFRLNNTVTITILGPTLNNYGLTGATNFSWSASSHGNSIASGTGEGSFSVSPGSLTSGDLIVTVTPTYYYEYGAVMIQAQY